MDSQRNSLQKAVEILQKSTSGVICLPQNPTPDAIGAALALYLGLTSMGKNVTVACSSSLEGDFMGLNKVQPEISATGNNLVISFPYKEGSIDKVDYYIQGNNFNIVVVPGAEEDKLSEKQVKFSYTGGSVDFIVTVDCDNLKRLGDLYSEKQDLFDKARIINLDRHLTNGFFGAANLVYRTASSTSEIVLSFLQAIKCNVDKDMATNLYQGMVAATKNFSSFSVTAQTFEDAAALLKLGARKKSPVAEGVFPRYVNAEFEKQTKAIEDIEKDQDFLKPKIFKPGTGENS